MKKIYSIFLAFCAFVAIAMPAQAQDPAQSLDARVNEAFASFTGPFVSFIFAPIPGTSFPWIVMWLVTLLVSQLLSGSAGRAPHSG